ncbi:START-like domain protein, partial [Nannochloropsis gaditana]
MSFMSRPPSAKIQAKGTAGYRRHNAVNCAPWRTCLVLSSFLLMPSQPFLVSSMSASAAASNPPTPPAASSLPSSSPASPADKMRHAFKDLKKQKQDMMDRVSGSLNKAKEMAGAAFGATEHHVEAANEHMLSRVLSVMNETEAHGWEHVTHRRGITVHRKFMPALNGVMSKFCCVRASGVLEASCLDVADLFEGNTRVAEYNKYFAEGRDLEHV